MKRQFASALLLLGSLSVARAQLNAPIGHGHEAMSLQISQRPLPQRSRLSIPCATDTFSQPEPKRRARFCRSRGSHGSGSAPGDRRACLPVTETEVYLWRHATTIAGSSVSAPLGTAFNPLLLMPARWLKTTGCLLSQRLVCGRRRYYRRLLRPTIFVNEHVKLATYGGGPKIAWRQKKWEPWMHGIFGGAHEQPQFAGRAATATRSSWWRSGFPLESAHGFPPGSRLRAHRFLQAVAKRLPASGRNRFPLLERRFWKNYRVQKSS